MRDLREIAADPTAAWRCADAGYETAVKSPPSAQSPDRRAGRFAVALLAAGACLVLIAMLTWHAGPIDARLYHDLHLTSGSALVRPVKLLTAIGSFAIIAPLALIGALAMLRRGNRGDAIWVVLTFALG